MSDAFCHVVPCRMEALGAADDALGAWLEREGVPGNAAYAARLALEELATNLIKYGQADPGCEGMRVQARLDEGWLCMEVTDEGRAFDPVSAPAPRTDQPLEEREVGGLGLHLVRRMFDEMRYARVGGKNRLELRKRLGKP